MSPVTTDETRSALATLRIPRRDDPPRARWAGRIAQFFFMVLLLGAIAVGGALLLQRNGIMNSNTEWIPEAIRSLPEVRVGKVAVEVGRSGDAVVVATGYLESYRQANIGARAAGRLQAVHVEEGTRVKEGEVIAVLDHKDIDAALAAMKAAHVRAQAELQEQDVEILRAKRELDRSEKLRPSNAVSEFDYDQAHFKHEAAVARRATLEAAVALAAARVLETEQFKENMIVRAPFDGTVISKDAEVGESILPGGMGEASGRGSVVTIADLDRLEVDCDVKEDYIGRVKNGSPAEVAVDAVPDRRYSARVRKVIPMGDRARATIKVKVEITDADERLFPEMSATVYFLPEPKEEKKETKEKRVFCDNTAIVSPDNGPYVWEVDSKLRVKKVAVELGNKGDTRTEVKSGLSGGERVVLNPPENLTAGQVVKQRD